MKKNFKEQQALSARTKTLLAAAMCLSVLVAGCLRYERQVVPFQTPQSSPNAVYMDGAVIAARSFIDAPQARAAFGFDIRAAGILPVQVVFDNKSPHPLMIVAEQTFLIDAESNGWPILDQNLAYDRLATSTEWSRVAPEAAKRGVLFGARGRRHRGGHRHRDGNERGGGGGQGRGRGSGGGRGFRRRAGGARSFGCRGQNPGRSENENPAVSGCAARRTGPRIYFLSRRSQNGQSAASAGPGDGHGKDIHFQHEAALSRGTAKELGRFGPFAGSVSERQAGFAGRGE